MFLYLVQHGQAKSEDADPRRSLTDDGIEDVRKIAAYARKANIRISRIFHSPKAGAQQTAKILAEDLAPDRGIGQEDNLLPMDDPGLWGMRIAGMREDIMLVGHLPYMAKLAGLLLCGDKEKMIVDFRMGGILCLKRFDDGRWAVEWMIVPEMV